MDLVITWTWAQTKPINRFNYDTLIASWDSSVFRPISGSCFSAHSYYQLGPASKQVIQTLSNPSLGNLSSMEWIAKLYDVNAAILSGDARIKLQPTSTMYYYNTSSQNSYNSSMSLTYHHSIVLLTPSFTLGSDEKYAISAGLRSMVDSMTVDTSTKFGR